MANTAEDTDHSEEYADLGWWDLNTGEFVPKSAIWEIPAKLSSIEDELKRQLKAIAGVFQEPLKVECTKESEVRVRLLLFSLVPSSYYKRVSANLPGGWRFEARELERQDAIGLMLFDKGDGDVTVTGFCLAPMLCADEFRYLMRDVIPTVWPKARWITARLRGATDNEAKLDTVRLRAIEPPANGLTTDDRPKAGTGPKPPEHEWAREQKYYAHSTPDEIKPQWSQLRERHLRVRVRRGDITEERYHDLVSGNVDRHLNEALQTMPSRTKGQWKKNPQFWIEEIERREQELASN
jgi:hypothetical protein